MVTCGKITVERIQALKPCWSKARLCALLGRGVRVGGALQMLLSLSPGDARWVLARLLNQERRVVWAKGAAKRAAEYALKPGYGGFGSYAAERAVEYAVAASASPEYASAEYAASAASAACNAFRAVNDEHELSCVLGLELLAEQEFS